MRVYDFFSYNFVPKMREVCVRSACACCIVCLRGRGSVRGVRERMLACIAPARHTTGNTRLFHRPPLPCHALPQTLEKRFQVIVLDEAHYIKDPSVSAWGGG